MITNIVDSEGILIYRGNDVDSEFATVLAKPGNVRLDGVESATDFEKPRWDGVKWVEGRTDMEIWIRDMKDTDKLPRWAEDLITDNPTFTINEYTKTKYDDKVALRATKP